MMILKTSSLQILEENCDYKTSIQTLGDCDPEKQDF